MPLPSKFLAHKFPHFIRKFTASLVSTVSFPLIIFILFSFLLLNLTSNLFTTITLERKLKQEILKNPFGSTPHIQLAQYFLSSNSKQAQQEYMLAQELFSLELERTGNQSVLGLQASPEDQWNRAQKKEDLLKQEIDYWNAFYTAHPDYIFAAYKIASAYIQLKDIPNARKYINEALLKSPNDPLGQKLKEMI